MSSSRPIIGITCPSRPTKWAKWELDAVVIPTTYHKMVTRCGGIPILIPPGVNSEIIDNIDGLIIAGGPDISPEIYGQENGKFTIETYPEQDISEISLIKSAIKTDTPLLCICRGFQLLCAIHDGVLYQHLPETDGFEEHGGWDGNVTEHEVKIFEEIRAEVLTYIYPADHGFNCDHRSQFNKRCSEIALDRTLKFLEKNIT